MAAKALVTLFIVCLSLHLAVSLRCYVCDAYSDGDKCKEPEKNNVKVDTCDSLSDLCFQITTIAEYPNNGPQDRMQDNGKYSLVSRGCANQKSFKHFSKVNKCDKENIGGGGTMEKCVCSGNKCNSAVSTQAGLTLVAAVLVAKFVL